MVFAVGGALFVAGYAAVYVAFSWVDANVVQPAVGGSEVLSLALFLAANACYGLFFFRFAKSGVATAAVENAPSVSFSVGAGMFSGEGGGDGGE